MLVDDAESVEDPSGALTALVGGAGAGAHVAVAVRADAARGLYDHWTKLVRGSRLGVLLRPDLHLDGDLLGTALPRRVAVPLVPGRGFLVVDGAAALVQVALPAAACGDAEAEPRRPRS